MSSLLLAGIVLFVVPLLLGTLWNHIGKALGIGKIEKTSIPGNYLPGVFVMLCFFEGMVIFSMKLDLAFSKVVFGVSIFFLLLCGLSCVFCQRELKMLLLPKDQNESKADRKLKGGKKLLPGEVYIILLLLIFMLQVFLNFHFAPVTGDDNTLEMVQTTLTTDTIGMYEPLTGQPYQTGPTLQGKLLSLPVFYAYMIQIFSADPAVFVYGIVPIWVLLMTYLSYSLIGDKLFRDEEKEIKKQMFLFLYGVLLMFGGYLFTTPGYQLLHGGWKGETIVVTVIIPYLISLWMGWKKERVMTLLHAVLAGVTVIPLMRWRKGMVYLGLLLVIFVITELCINIRRKDMSQTNKKES